MKTKDEKDERLFRVSWWIGSGAISWTSLQVFQGYDKAREFADEKSEAGYCSEVINA